MEEVHGVNGDTHDRIERLRPVGEGSGTSQMRVRLGRPKRIRRDVESRYRPSSDGTKCVSEWKRKE